MVVYYSGHGSQMTDREGDEPYGFDETLVPHDSSRAQNPNRDITDNEVYAWLWHRSRPGSPTPDRQHDVSQLTAGRLERTWRDLRISLTQIIPSSWPVRPSWRNFSAIAAEVAERTAGG